MSDGLEDVLEPADDVFAEIFEARKRDEAGVAS